MNAHLYLFFSFVVLVVVYQAWRSYRLKPSANFRSVDAILPAYNEELLIEVSIRKLLENPYVKTVICVNDGSTDGTAAVLDRLNRELGATGRFLGLHQANTGKGGALMHGIRRSTADYVFLTDADTVVPSDRRLGYLLAEIEAGADAVGGIATPNLQNATLPPFVRASVKIPMTIIKRTMQQLLGGAPFIVSGSCGMFRRSVILEYGFSDRTKVEDLDLTWTLIAAGKKIRLAPRCVVYPQSCRTVLEDWKRYRRWIVGYAVCMRLHKNLLLTRYGVFSIMPMFALVMAGVYAYLEHWFQVSVNNGLLYVPLTLFPVLWVCVTFVLGSITALHYRKPVLIALAPFAVFYIFLAYTVWIVHGLRGLITGREPQRDKPTRYAYVAE